MTKHETNSDFFDSLEKLIQELHATTKLEAANELQNGLSCLNGLTDGWGLLMESINKVISDEKYDVPEAIIEKLEPLLETVRQIVYRK